MMKSLPAPWYFEKEMVIFWGSFVIGN